MHGRSERLPPFAAALTVAFVVMWGWLTPEAGRDAERQADATATRIAAAAEQDVGRNIELFDLTLQTTIALLQSPAIRDLDPDQRNLGCSAQRPAIGMLPSSSCWMGAGMSRPVCAAADRYAGVLPMRGREWSADVDAIRLVPVLRDEVVAAIVGSKSLANG